MNANYEIICELKQPYFIGAQFDSEDKFIGYFVGEHDYCNSAYKILFEFGKEK